MADNLLQHQYAVVRRLRIQPDSTLILRHMRTISSAHHITRTDARTARVGATGSVSHLRSEQEQLPLPRPLPTGSSGQDLLLQLDLLTENAYTFVDADLSGHMYTSGNDWPTGGANGVATIQQKTHSCYQANRAAADQQQAIDN